MFCHVKLSACFWPNVVVWCLLFFGLICPTTRLSGPNKRRELRQTINEAADLRTPKPRRLSVSA